MVAKHSSCLDCIFNLPSVYNALGIVDVRVGKDRWAASRGLRKVRAMFRANVADGTHAYTFLAMNCSCRHARVKQEEDMSDLVRRELVHDKWKQPVVIGGPMV